jgi:hypothetical protein
MSSDLQIVSLTKLQLSEAYKDNRYWKRGELNVISRNKALWLLNSPRIENDDFCFFFAMANNKIVAFISVIPDIVKIKTGSLKKIYWMTQWWTDKTFEKTILPTYLFQQSLALTQNNILIKQYAQNVHNFYSKQPFECLKLRPRYTTFFSLNPDSLIQRFPRLKHLRSLLHLNNYIVKNSIYRLNKVKNKPRTNDLSYEYLNELDIESWEFINAYCSNDVIYKTKEYVNWQLDSRQYLQAVVAEKHNLKSTIEGYSEKVHIFLIKVVKNDTMIGFLSFLNFDGVFYLKYFISAHENFGNMVDAFMEHLLKLKASHLYSENDKVIKAIKKRYLTTFTHAPVKTALAHNDLFQNLKNTDIQDQDGHFI